MLLMRNPFSNTSNQERTIQLEDLNSIKPLPPSTDVEKPDYSCSKVLKTSRINSEINAVRIIHNLNFWKQPINQHIIFKNLFINSVQSGTKHQSLARADPGFWDGWGSGEVSRKRFHECSKRPKENCYSIFLF